MPNADIDEAIAEITGVRAEEQRRVFIYGQMVRASRPAFEFIVSRGRDTEKVKLMVSQVKRYRDGESSLFLIEITEATARINNIERFVLSDEEVAWLKRGGTFQIY